MRTVNVLEAKTTLSALLAEVEAGGEVIIARAGTPVARLVAVERGRPRPIGIDDGRIRISDDFDTFVPDELNSERSAPRHECVALASGSSNRLGARARALLEDDLQQTFFSVVSAWEIVIKVRLDKLDVVGEPDDYVRSRVRMQRLAVLPMTLEHALGVANLPAHHRDPFDRLLVAQAACESLALLSSDGRMRAYDVEWIDARV